MIITVIAGGDITMVRGEDALHSKYGRPLPPDGSQERRAQQMLYRK
jgi:hypothetical protein